MHKLSSLLLHMTELRVNVLIVPLSDPPEKVKLAMSPSGGVIKGGSVTFTCSSDANPPVLNGGYSLYKGRSFVEFGQNHTISGIQPAHSGLYHCQAMNGISQRGLRFFQSMEVLLNVQCMYANISCHHTKCDRLWPQFEG